MIAYANFYTFDLLAVVPPGGGIPYNNQNVPPVGISQINAEQFFIEVSGVYFITYGVHYTVATQVLPATTTITVNGIPSNAMEVRSGNEIDAWSISSGMMFLNAGDVVSVINDGPGELAMNSGLPGAEAYLNFLRIA